MCGSFSTRVEFLMKINADRACSSSSSFILSIIFACIFIIKQKIIIHIKSILTFNIIHYIEINNQY